MKTMFISLLSVLLSVSTALSAAIGEKGSSNEKIIAIPLKSNCSSPLFLTLHSGKNVDNKPNVAGLAATVMNEVKPSATQVRRWRLEDCDNFNLAQMNHVLQFYPLVQVICEKQGLIIYPEALDETSLGPHSTSKSWRETFGREFFFKEFMIKTNESETSHKYPLAQCTEFSDEMGLATTEVRITISGSAKGGPELSYGAPIPYFGLNSAVGASHGVTGSMYISHGCNQKQALARPFISLKTLSLTISTRRWTVRPSRKNFIKKTSWNKIPFTALSSKAPVVSCVSELYVPGVCSWDMENSKVIFSHPN